MLACLCWTLSFFVFAGASFTTKLEGMFKDMDLSRDVQREFVEQHIKTIPNWPNDVEMGIQVLTTVSHSRLTFIIYSDVSQSCLFGALSHSLI